MRVPLLNFRGSWVPLLNFEGGSGSRVPGPVVLVPLLHHAAVRRCFSKKIKIRNMQRKTPVLESLFNKVAGLKACNFIKKRLKHSCFPVNIEKILRAAFFKEHLRWPPLNN